MAMQMNLDIKTISEGRYVLWGANWSLYTAKVRPYLIKKRIDYVEVCPSHPHFNDHIIPTVGYFTVPVLETPEGEIIADSTRILEHLETKFPDPPMLPEDKALAALAYLIHCFGSEGMHKSAMYQRWNTSYENRLFARNEFKRTTATPEIAETFAVSMRSYLPVLGIGHDHSIDMAVEKSIDALYDSLNTHFLKYPYILGGLPSLADYGLMGPLYAHHGRDISSNNRMKVNAPAVYRWVENMLRPPIVDQENWHVPQEYFSVDELPDTLQAFLKLIGKEYIPEVRAVIGLYHDWLDAEDRPAGAIVDVEGKKRCHQALGEIEHVQMDTFIRRIGLLDDVSQHSRFQAQLDQMSDSEMKSLRKILEGMGAGDYADLRLKRDVKRQAYAWVLV